MLVTVELLKLVSIVGGVVIPLYLWGYNISNRQKKILEMLENPEKYGLGNSNMEVLLESHAKNTEDIFRMHTDAVKELASSIKALTYYTKWQTEQLTGKKAPPPL